VSSKLSNLQIPPHQQVGSGEVWERMFSSFLSNCFQIISLTLRQVHSDPRVFDQYYILPHALRCPRKVKVWCRDAHHDH
jgi:hypothetical protein